MQKLLHILDNNEYNEEKRRSNEDESENWNGRWMPDRPDDPKPPPKVLPKSQRYEYEPITELPQEIHWTGRWMPDKPGDPKPPPKVLPKNQQHYEYESIVEFPHEKYMGHVSPECDDAKVATVFIYIYYFNWKEHLSIP